MIRYTLSQDEVDIVTNIAKHRNDNSTKNRTSMKLGDQGDLEANIAGVAGEFVMCKHLNVFFDVRTDFGLESLPSHDLVTRKGKTVDVKTTARMYNQFFIRAGKKQYADVFMFVVGEIPTFDLVGWITKDDAIQDRRLGDYGKGESYVIPINLLKSFR